MALLRVVGRVGLVAFVGRVGLVGLAVVGCTFDGTGLGGPGSAAASVASESASSSGGETTTGEGTSDPSAGTTESGPTTAASGSASDPSSGSTGTCEAMKEYFLDFDKDGFGGGEPVLACSAPPGHSAYDGDCDDGDPDVHPAADEVCDGLAIDEDCDGLINEHSAKNTACGLCSLGYFVGSDHVYWFCKGGVNWDVARAACENFGADLATIGGNGENEFVRAGAATFDVWLGGRDQDPQVPYAYTWVDGAALVYTQWVGGDPDRDDGCIVMRSADAGGWRSVGCGDAAVGYVCESAF